MNRIDNLELIELHAIEQSVYSEIYMESLNAMSDDEIEAELERLEEIALNEY
jgi:hypothetical protein